MSSQARHRHNLITIMVGAFVGLLAFTVRASLERGVFDNAELMRDVWFQVTLVDAYLGFVIFYVWVAFKEKSLIGRIVWFVLIMCFGNMATAVYVVLQIRRHPADRPLVEFLLPQCPNSGSAQTADSV